MPTTVAIEQGVPSAGARRATYGFFRFGFLDVILAVWAVTVLLIGANYSSQCYSELCANWARICEQPEAVTRPV
jgi:hypothetical protein